MCDETGAPTPEHLKLLADVEMFVEKWAWLPWLRHWHITVHPCDCPPHHEWGMRIEAMNFISCAKILVTPEADNDDGFFPEGEYSLELATMHELCHLLFDPFRTQVYNCGTMEGAIPEHFVTVLDTEEEKAVWLLCRSMLQLEKKGLLLKDIADETNNLVLGPGLRHGGQRRPLGRARLPRSGSAAQPPGLPSLGARAATGYASFKPVGVSRRALCGT